MDQKSTEIIKNHLTTFSMPKSGKIKARMRVKEEFGRTITFFCSLNENKEPNLHLSINSENRIWFARHHQDIGWIDILSQSVIVPNRMFSLQIFYGELGDRIFVDESEETVLTTDYSYFAHPGNLFISFGDLSNVDSLSSGDLIYVENFKITGNRPDDKTISIVQPKIITEEYI